MNEKQQQLTFDKGITNVPSDALCSDNALEESLGMVYDNGEHRVIQKPVVFMTGTQYVTIVYVHRFNNEDRFIGYMNTVAGIKLVAGKNVNGVYTALAPIGGSAPAFEIGSQVTSIGKTLIISDSQGLHYYLWTDDSYNPLGALPDIQLSVKMVNSAVRFNIEYDEGDYVENSGSAEGMFEYASNNVASLVNGKQEAFNNLVVGLYSKNKKSVGQKKAFCEPFFVRAALQMYDDSYTYITNPVLLYPSVTRNSFGYQKNNGSDDLILRTYYSKLYVKQITDYSSFSDVVKDVVLFISDGINIGDTAVDQIIRNRPMLSVDGCSTTLDGEGEPGVCEYHFNMGVMQGIYYDIPNSMPRKDIENDIKSTSIFYNLCSIGFKGTNGYIDVAEKIGTHDLENIITREQIQEDDYYSRCKLYPSFIYAYNSRLNIANVLRGFFSGYKNFICYEENNNSSYDITVRIKGDVCNYHVNTGSFSTNQRITQYFYFPDSRADHVWIKKEGAIVLNAELTEHPNLNGAYYYSGLPGSEAPAQSTEEYPEIVDNDAKEYLPNYVIQSEVNNPFIFKAVGYFKVGTGKILAMSSITQALSEGQFGQFPLLVFSESGIWSLSVASTGYYDTIHPMSREVSLDPACIVQTDGAVFFTSEKGLMVVVGNQVKCVSEQLSGKDISFMVDVNGTPAEQTVNLGNFTEYLRSAYIAYDYRDSLLWIFNNNYDACWVYSIKSGTFGKYDFGSGKRVNNVVNFYPDYLMQNTNEALSLLERPNINNDGTTSNNVFTENTYNTKLITRPMKFENALALKSIMQIRHIKDFTPYPTPETVDGETVTNNMPKTALRIFASNNMDHWAELGSLRGMPWKYYKFCFDFTGLKATDRFSGSMIVTQERRTNKMR